MYLKTSRFIFYSLPCVIVSEKSKDMIDYTNEYYDYLLHKSIKEYEKESKIIVKNSALLFKGFIKLYQYLTFSFISKTNNLFIVIY